MKKNLMDGLCILSTGFRHFEPEENILITGSPRSGSTWIAELISCWPDSVILWEPLHLREVKPFRELGFGWRPYISEETEWEEAKELFTNLFKGAYLNYWLSSRASPLKFCRAERMIVKFVRANGILPWLTKNFEFKYAPIYLLRHPLAVVASRKKEGSWDYEFDGFEIPDSPFLEIFEEHKLFLSTLKNKQEAMVAMWCMNNKVVLDNRRNNSDWITLHYESMLLNAESELNRIFNRWNVLKPDGILDEVKSPSSTAQEITFSSDERIQLTKWKKFFDEDDILRIQRVLDYFEIKSYSAETVLPATMA